MEEKEQEFDAEKSDPQLGEMQNAADSFDQTIDSGVEPVRYGQPNIVFVGRRELHGETVELDAPATLRDGPTEFVDLPDSATQKKGFYHPEAARIIRAFPQFYKAIVKKGEK